MAAPTAGTSSPLTGATTTWSCLTAGHTGIFSSARGCATATGTIRALGRVSALEVPGASGNLTGSVSGSTVTLTWLAPTSADAASYVIEAGSFPGAINLASFDTGNSSTTLTVTAVPSGTYYVRARAKNSTGTSAPSNEVVLTVTGTGTAPCTGPPAAPSGLTATANGSSVTLTWNASNGACAATTYILEAGSSTGGTNLANSSTGNTATTFSTSGVGAGTYYVRVRAANGSGTGGPSNEVILTVGGGSAPSTPSPTSSVRWVGLAPEGMVVDSGLGQCPREYDLQLDLTTSGTAVTGTAITRLRRVGFSSCSDVLGELANWSVINGTVGSGTISFALGQTGAMRFSGTFTATRMTGTFVLREFTIYSQTGSFAVNRQ